MSFTRRFFATAAAFGLALAVLSGGQALAQRDPPAPPATQAEFRTFIAEFRQALRANDASAVASLTRMPIYYDDAFRDRAYFETRIYRRMFTQRDRNCLQTARPVYYKDGEGTEGFSLFCGRTIFIFTKKTDGFRFEGTHPDD
ncbi:hypothetical protein [Phreatobacter oligotrophus]|jgi:hypothetical protein|uniref:DUF4440 domain-containing protein n=1 Tax=Phreatobacter oligotrophus TaxID=1122261 RepID=A0A2T4YXK5_9HYPH|nr:hypothetical protein [Phreatobacter oligotrophus]PTM50889.1 hypothetical protein C8P69_11251 [Phreatobacter oligotrophus]